VKVKKWQFWFLNACATIVLIVVFINISLFQGNRSVQAVVLQQQQFINESIRLSRINAQLIRALATLSAQTSDLEIRALLAEHGVTFTFNPDQEQIQQ
jgi:hypothetical protein